MKILFVKSILAYKIQSKNNKSSKKKKRKPMLNLILK